MSDELFFNGIDAVTGNYLTPPTTMEQLVADATGEPLDPGHTADLRTVGSDHLGVAEDPRELDRVGWAVVVAENDPAAQDALQQLQPLLNLRREQAGDRYRKLVYKSGDTKNSFLARYGKGAGAVSPDKVPYYLLIVGSPEAVPYSLQYDLDVQYAVGRVWFATAQEYANYAVSVVAAETGSLSLARNAAFLAVSRDKATEQSADFLVNPLVRWMAGNAPGWTSVHVTGDDATKARLAGLLGGTESPAFLFAASHGITFPRDHPDQPRKQGALICADWPGPDGWTDKPLLPDFYFSADDVDPDAHLAGLISFTFACYSAGTPKIDDFDQLRLRQFTQLADMPFVAGLPARLLGHPNGGALAAVGHVDRTWGYSFLTEESRRETEVFSSMLDWLLKGYPVGAAMEFFGMRYAELGNELLPQLLQAQEMGKAIGTPAFVGQLTAHMDSRSYVIVGDPAVRLPVSSDNSAAREVPIVVAPPADSAQANTPDTESAVPVALPRSDLLDAISAEIDQLAEAERQRATAMASLLGNLRRLVQSLRAEEEPAVHE